MPKRLGLDTRDKGPQSLIRKGIRKFFQIAALTLVRSSSLPSVTTVNDLSSKQYKKVSDFLKSCIFQVEEMGQRKMVRSKRRSKVQEEIKQWGAARNYANIKAKLK